MRNLFLKLFACISTALFGCKDGGAQTQTKVYTTPTDTVVAKEITSPTAGKYRIRDLTPELKQYLADRLQDARQMVQEYHHGTAVSPYDAKIVDEVLDNWRLKKGEKGKAGVCD